MVEGPGFWASPASEMPESVNGNMARLAGKPGKMFQMRFRTESGNGTYEVLVVFWRPTVVALRASFGETGCGAVQRSGISPIRFFCRQLDGDEHRRKKDRQRHRFEAHERLRYS